MPVAGDELRWLVQVWQEIAAAWRPQKGFPWKTGCGQQLIPSLPCNWGHEGLCKPHLLHLPGSQDSWGEDAHKHLLEQQRWVAFGICTPQYFVPLFSYLHRFTLINTYSYYVTLLLSTDFQIPLTTYTQRLPQHDFTLYNGHRMMQAGFTLTLASSGETTKKPCTKMCYSVKFTSAAGSSLHFVSVRSRAPPGFLWAKNLLQLSLKERLQHEDFSIKLHIVVQIIGRAHIKLILN